MTMNEYKQSLHQPQPPAAMAPLLQALWWDGRGDWARSHTIAQDERGADAAWVHAYLHRKEGDDGNAGFWYRQAGRAPCDAPLEQEWIEIVSELLRSPPAINA